MWQHSAAPCMKNTMRLTDREIKRRWRLWTEATTQYRSINRKQDARQGGIMRKMKIGWRAWTEGTAMLSLHAKQDMRNMMRGSCLIRFGWCDCIRVQLMGDCLWLMSNQSMSKRVYLCRWVGWGSMSSLGIYVILIFKYFFRTFV